MIIQDMSPLSMKSYSGILMSTHCMFSVHIAFFKHIFDSDVLKVHGERETVILQSELFYFSILFDV